MTVRYIGPDPYCICGDTQVIEKSITFLKGVATPVPKDVADWAMGMNQSLQATVFEMVLDHHGGGD